MASSSNAVVISPNGEGPSQPPPPPLTFWERSAQGGTLVPIAWHNGLSKIGQEFRDKKHFNDTLVNYCIARGFNIKYLANSTRRVTAKCGCMEKKCPWRIHASAIGTSGIFKIKTWTNQHCCGGGIKQRGHPRASRKWVANLVKPALKARPLYAPVEMKKDILREYGIDLEYTKVWHGREIARTELHGKEAHAYSFLGWYCDQVRQTNPGSIAVYEVDHLGRFSRLFICYHGPLEGFIRGCRKMLFIDGTFITSRYQGVMLAASAKNGNQGTFPLAFGLCGAENETNWRWFLEQLHSALYSREVPLQETLTFISDRDKGLMKSIADIFPSSYHGYCLRHLEHNFAMTAGKGLPLEERRDMPKWLQKVAYAMTETEFDEAVAYIGERCARGLQFISDSNPSHWANMYFQGQRYGEMYSNLAESFNRWAKDARQLPILQLLEMLQTQVMEQIYHRSEKAKSWTTVLCPEIHKEMEYIIQQSRFSRVLFCDGNQFGVTDLFNVAVDLDARICSCRFWQVRGIPCKHACAAILSRGSSVDDYVDKYFTTEAFGTSYSFPIYPIGDVDRPPVDPENLELLPPQNNKRKGRKRKSRRKSGLELFEVRPLHCSRCGQEGHNRATCTVASVL